MRRTCEEVFPNSLNAQPNQENINHYNEIEMSAMPMVSWACIYNGQSYFVTQVQLKICE